MVSPQDLGFDGQINIESDSDILEANLNSGNLIINIVNGEHQVLSVGIAEMSSASRLYGTIRDFDTDELIPYAEVQLNCEQASDWDHTGEIGTYRVFSYYPDDCADGDPT